MPDLIISSAEVKSKSATAINITFAIQNIGNSRYTYKDAFIEFYFSNDDVIDFNSNAMDRGRFSFSNTAERRGFTIDPSSSFLYKNIFSYNKNVLNYQYCMIRIKRGADESNYDNNVFRLYLN